MSLYIKLTINSLSSLLSLRRFSIRISVSLVVLLPTIFRTIFGTAILTILFLQVLLTPPSLKRLFLHLFSCRLFPFSVFRMISAAFLAIVLFSFLSFSFFCDTLLCFSVFCTRSKIRVVITYTIFVSFTPFFVYFVSLSFILFLNFVKRSLRNIAVKISD